MNSVRSFYDLTDSEVYEEFEAEMRKTNVISEEFKQHLKWYMRAIQGAAYKRGKSESMVK